MNRAIITKLYVTQPQQVIVFQIKIPRDAVCITGIRVTMTAGVPASEIPTGVSVSGSGGFANSFSAPPPVNPHLPATSPQWVGFISNIFLGDLRLQSYGRTNILIAEDIYFQDSNIGQGDFTSTAHFSPKDWSYGLMNVKSEILEEGSVAVLKGIYRNRVPISYTVGIYIWYEKNKESV